METKTIFAIVVTIVIGGIAVYAGNHSATEVYTKPSATSTVEVVEPEWASNEEARAAAEAVIKRQQLEKRQSELTAQIDELQAELADVEKELGVY